MASASLQRWFHATVPIQNPEGESGTGFLVFRKTGSDEGRVFLVTNKHVICRDPARRSSVQHVKCHFNTKQSGGGPSVLSGEIPLVNANGSKRFREHPDADTDVFAVEVTDLIQPNPQIEWGWVSYDLFALQPKRTELDITLGEDVITIGYPLGLRQGDTNFPLIRQGVISTKIGSLFKDKAQAAGGSYRDRTLRAFLIDGATVPGSSGSPVILKPVIGRWQGNNLNVGMVVPPVLLGIIAETLYAPVQLEAGVIPSFAGLGLAFEVETIQETIELFFS